MPLFGAEMWNINDGGRIINEQAHDLPVLQTGHTFARPEHWQRAQKAPSINFNVPFHESDLSRVVLKVYGIVQASEFRITDSRGMRINSITYGLMKISNKTRQAIIRTAM